MSKYRELVPSTISQSIKVCLMGLTKYKNKCFTHYFKCNRFSVKHCGNWGHMQTGWNGRAQCKWLNWVFLFIFTFIKMCTQWVSFHIELNMIVYKGKKTLHSFMPLIILPIKKNNRCRTFRAKRIFKPCLDSLLLIDIFHTFLTIILL